MKKRQRNKKVSVYSKFQKYYELSRYLKTNLPIKYKVVVRRLPLNKIDGDCLLFNKKFIVRINNKLSEELAMETLIHEFSHCLSYHCKGNDHGPEWGKAYSKTYREFLKWNENTDD